MILKFLHVIGLTNLSDADVEKYYATATARLNVTTVYDEAMTGGASGVKRMLDFFASLILLILFFPLFVVVAVLIKATSRGPIFFIQDRIGSNKRRFSFYNFRSMFKDAERRLDEIEYLKNGSGPIFKIIDDPRITPVGRFLIKTSIDELPELFNVLKGDMSLVGPRPLSVRDYQQLDKDWQRRRFSVRPGLTCYWRLQRGSGIPIEKEMELDTQYIEYWTLWLDLKLLLKTISVLKNSALLGKG